MLADPDALAAVPGLVVHGSHNAETFAGMAFHVYWERYRHPPEDPDRERYAELVEASVPPAEQARRESPAADDPDWEGDEDQRYPRLIALLDAQGVPPLFVSQSTFSLSATPEGLRLSDGAVTLVFEPFYEVHLRSTLVGLRVREMSAGEARSWCSLPLDEGRYFLVLSQRFVGHVVAGRCQVA